MSARAFVADRDEWRAVAQAASAVRQSERAGGSVLLTCRAGHRLWVIKGIDTVIVVEGGHQESQLELHLSPRLVRYASHLAQLHGSCRLEVVDRNTAVVSAGGFSGAIDLVEVDDDASEVPVPWDQAADGIVLAEVTVEHLLTALAAARDVPEGIDFAEEGTPPLWLRIGDCSISTHVDWSTYGAPRATFTVPALTQGSLLASIPHAVLHSLLCRSALSGDATVRIEADPKSFTARVQTPLWTAYFDADEQGTADIFAEVRRIVASSGLDVYEVGSHEVAFGLRREVRAQVHPTSPPTIRVSTIVIWGIEVTSEVLAELNELNAGLPGITLWAEQGAIVAAVDLPWKRASEVITTANRLIVEADHLAPLLAAFGGHRGAVV